MLTFPSWKSLRRSTINVTGALAVFGGIPALATADATSATTQTTPDDDPTCPDCTIQFDLVMTVGSLDGPDWLPGEPYSVARDSRGRLYLAFPMQGLLPVFDSAGQPLPPVGRSGEGPGEYQLAHLVRVGRADTLNVSYCRGQGRWCSAEIPPGVGTGARSILDDSSQSL